MSQHRTEPDPKLTRLPGGIPFIIGNEVAERFSFYGMKGILTVYMTKHLLDSAGQPDFMGDDEAKKIYHLFTAAAYFFPLIGSLLSDIFLGKYRTIILLSMGYCIGHACLAMGDTGIGAFMEPRTWLFVGMAFIAMGAGGIKPCVSAHVGDQFGAGNKHLISKVFSWFYFSINVGAMLSTLLIPVILEAGHTENGWSKLGLPGGPAVAFGLPGILMAIATFVFWLGRHRFIHVPPGGWDKFKSETFSPEGKRALINLAPIFLIFIPMFWAIFDQTGSAWVLQADHLDKNFLGREWLPSQIQAVNPFFILVLIPLFAYVVYPVVSKVWLMTPLRKIGVGLFLTAGAFAISAWLESQIVGIDAQLAAGTITADAAEAMRPSVAWQFLAYIVLTAAEVMVSITSLEFAYTQAPKKMKSFIMGIYFMGVSLGNLFTSGVNALMEKDVITLDGASYYWFFTILMLATAVLFIFMALVYKGQTFIQGQGDMEAESEMH